MMSTHSTRASSAWRKAGGRGRPWIAVESALQHGRRPCADLADLVAIADRHDAMLLVDEAHATGVLGPDGRGLTAAFEGRDNIITLHTCGKALGASGALVLAPSDRARLPGQSRPALHLRTAPSPLMRGGDAQRAAGSRGEQPSAPRTARALVAPCRARTGGTLRPHLVAVAYPAGDRRRRTERAVALANALQAARLRRARASVHRPCPKARHGCASRCHAKLTRSRDRRPVRRDGGWVEAARVTRQIVVTGTDTDIGKTVFSAGLAGALERLLLEAGAVRARGGDRCRRCAPTVRTGARADRCPKRYRLTTPASPHLAADIDGVTIDTDAAGSARNAGAAGHRGRRRPAWCR